MLEKDLQMILDLEAEQVGDLLEQVSLKQIYKTREKHVLKEFLMTINNHKTIYVMEIGPMIYMLKNWITMLEKD